MSGSKLSKRIEVHVEQVNDSLYTLHKPGGIPTMQIIFFHGLYLEDSLDTHLYTWESGDGSCIWPQTWLVEDFPGAHVLTVSYCECVKSASNMYVIGENLTQDLEQGEIGQIPGCPVVLVGHSVGGLVIKKLCLHAHDRLYILPKTKSSERTKLETFLDNIKGIFYYSTPHYGSSHVAEAGDLDSPLFKYFNALNAEASQMNHRFEHLCALHTKWLIHGISESLPTNSTLIRDVIVVPEASARQGQRFSTVATDHYSICKPKSKKLKGFTALTYLLVNIQEEDERRRHEGSRVDQARIGEDSPVAEPSQNSQQSPIRKDNLVVEPPTQYLQQLPIPKDSLVVEPRPQNLQQLPICQDGPMAEPRTQNCHIHFIDSDTKVQRELVAVGRKSERAQSDATVSGSASKGSPKNVSIHMENLQVEKSLRDQLVRLLSLNGQRMYLIRVPAEYKKQFGQPLFSEDNGHFHAKLVNLLEQLKDWMLRSGEGRKKMLYLTKTGSEVAAKLKREANNNSRGPPKGEVEVNLIDSVDFNTKLQVRDVGDEDDETVGAPKGEVEEELLLPLKTEDEPRRHEESRVDQPRIGEDSPVAEPHPQNLQQLPKSEDGQVIMDGVRDGDLLPTKLEYIQLPTYDWGFGSGGSGGSGDQKDSSVQEEATDVEVDESTVEQIVKTKKGNNRTTAAGGLDILDTFRVELGELLVSFACKIPMTSFVELYQQRYSKVLDYEKFGVKDLEALVREVSDMAEIAEIDVKDLVADIQKVSDAPKVFLEYKKDKLKVLVAHRSSDVGRI